MASRKYGTKKKAMDTAAQKGDLDIIKWLQEQKNPKILYDKNSEPCSSQRPLGGGRVDCQGSCSTEQSSSSVTWKW
ncbi:hypothetical protein PC116_g29147 [Phytophthora cactorum]|nr:hypothetical protein PC116_g29147 [Phytophthora cactorum]